MNLLIVGFKRKLFIVFLILFFGFVMLFKGILILPKHWDEMYPISKSWRFNKFFITRDYSKQAWQLSKDDHLPMANYIVGAALYFFGWFSAEKDNLFPTPEADLLQGDCPYLKDSIFATAFLIGRTVMAFFALLSILVLYWVLRRRFSEVTSFLAVLLTIFNPLFLQVSPRLFLESLQGFFLVTSLFFLIKWVRGEKSLFWCLIWSFFLGVFSAFCYLTKINGVLALGAALLCVVVFFLKKLISVKKFLMFLAVSFFTFFIFVTLLFPPFWRNPFKLHRDLFSWRLDITKEHQNQAPHYSIWQKEKYRPLEFESATWGGSIKGPAESFAMVIFRLFWYFDPIRRILKIPLFVILGFGLLIGLAGRLFGKKSIKVKRRERGEVGFLLGTWAFFVFIVYLFTLMQDVPRYYYLLIFPFGILISFGLETLGHFSVASIKKLENLLF